MGATNSRMGSSPSTPRVNRFRLSFLICGGSSSRSTYQMEDHPSEVQSGSGTDFDEVQKVSEESSLSYCTRDRISSPNVQTATSFGTINDNTTVESSSRNVGTGGQRKCLSECKELVPPHQVSADPSHDDSYRDSSNTASTSSLAQQSSDPVSVNVSANKGAVDNVYDSVDSGVSHISHETVHPRRSPLQVHGDSSSDEISIENYSSVVTATENSNSDLVDQISNSPVSSHFQENEHRQETIPSGLGFLVPHMERGQSNESLFQVDFLTISSNMLSGSNSDDHDVRRHGRRLFWDAFSRRNSRRFGDSPTIVFSAGDADDPESQDRWLLDLSGDFSNDGTRGESGYLGSRVHRLNRRMRHSRSEILQRLRGGFDEINQWNTSCPLGLHPDGMMCSCESLPMAEESGTRASMSRIVMLAEALFEVLDEIHRQPASLSLSMVSLPAPESVVDSFPLKCHKKVDAANGSDTEQCYICLVEYEEGDKIRVLPCQHEYHMSCVDKWLKEIHGVCPLCRGNVCGEGVTESSPSNPEVPSS